MIIYNVTMQIEADIANEWVSWMKSEHMPDLMSTGLFTDCRLCKLLEQDETEGLTFSAQYICETMEQYTTYLDKYAQYMRDKVFKLFGGKFIAFRTVMEVI